MVGRRGRDDEAVLERRHRRVVDAHAAQDLVLRLGVVVDRARRRVHEQHLARPQPLEAHDLRGVEWHGARLRRERHDAVTRHGPGRGTQPVAVEDRADLAAIGEDERRGAVPRGDEPGDPAAERGERRVGRATQRCGIGHQREQRLGHRPAGRCEELDRLVEGAGVGSTLAEQRTGVEQPTSGGAAHRRQRAVVASAADGFAVAADGVDLAVVGEEAERLGERPRGCGVGRVPLVEHRERHVQRLEEVRLERAEARPRDEALVDERPRRRRRDREAIEAPGPRHALGSTPRADERQLEPAGRPAGGSGDECLLDRRPRGTRLGAQGGGVRRDGAPARDLQAFEPERLRQDGPACDPSRSGPGQEGRHHPEPVAGGAGRIEEEADRRSEREQDARPVARFTVRREGATVTEGREAGQREREHPPGGPSTGIRDEPDAARVVLEGGVVERRVGRPTMGASAHVDRPTAGHGQLWYATSPWTAMSRPSSSVWDGTRMPRTRSTTLTMRNVAMTA